MQEVKSRRTDRAKVAGQTEPVTFDATLHKSLSGNSRRLTENCQTSASPLATTLPFNISQPCEPLTGLATALSFNRSQPCEPLTGLAPESQS